MMQALKGGLLYFVVVFAVGFVLGTIRTLWVIPRFGARTAELMETPIMLIVSIVTARWTVARFVVPSMPSARLAFHFRTGKGIASVKCPRHLKRVDIAAIDLVDSRIADAFRAPAVDFPVAIPTRRNVGAIICMAAGDQE